MILGTRHRKLWHISICLQVGIPLEDSLTSTSYFWTNLGQFQGKINRLIVISKLMKLLQYLGREVTKQVIESK